MVRLAVVVLVLEILGALSLVAGVLSFGQSAANNAAIVKLNAALDRQAAEQAATADITRQFFDEINYICTIVAEKNKPSPPGICSLSLPPP